MHHHQLQIGSRFVRRDLYGVNPVSECSRWKFNFITSVTGYGRDHHFSLDISYSNFEYLTGI
jgi:hypothetical protein